MPEPALAATPGPGALPTLTVPPTPVPGVTRLTARPSERRRAWPWAAAAALVLAALVGSGLLAARRIRPPTPPLLPTPMPPPRTGRIPVYCEAKLEPVFFRKTDQKDVADSLADLENAIAKRGVLDVVPRDQAEAVVQVLERGRGRLDPRD